MIQIVCLPNLWYIRYLLKCDTSESSWRFQWIDDQLTTSPWSGLSKSLSLRNCAISIIKCLEFERQLVLPIRLKLVLMFQASLHIERWKYQGNFGHSGFWLFTTWSHAGRQCHSCVFRTTRTIEHEAAHAIGHLVMDDVGQWGHCAPNGKLY